MRIKFSAGHTNLYQRSQIILRYLRFLIRVTKSCRLCIFKKDKKVKELPMFFFCIVADAVCLLTAIAHTVQYTSFFCIITIELFCPARLCHLTFVTLAHTVWHSGAFYTWFLPFVTSASATWLCRALAQVIFLYVTMIFFTLVHAISFCWVSIRYIFCFHDSRCSFCLLGTSKCYLSLAELASPYITWFLVIWTYRPNSINEVY